MVHKRKPHAHHIANLAQREIWYHDLFMDDWRRYDSHGRGCQLYSLGNDLIGGSVFYKAGPVHVRLSPIRKEFVAQLLHSIAADRRGETICSAKCADAKAVFLEEKDIRRSVTKSSLSPKKQKVYNKYSSEYHKYWGRANEADFFDKMADELLSGKLNATIVAALLHHIGSSMK